VAPCRGGAYKTGCSWGGIYRQSPYKVKTGVGIGKTYYFKIKKKRGILSTFYKIWTLFLKKGGDSKPLEDNRSPLWEGKCMGKAHAPPLGTNLFLMV
jgi:hypothetical protein